MASITFSRYNVETPTNYKQRGRYIMAPHENGWHEYSKLVLEQLESLSTGIGLLRTEMQEIKQELAIMKAKEDKVTELKIWKDKVDEVASPRQMLYALKEIEELKIFKTKAVTIFMVIQGVVGLALGWLSLYG